MEKRMQSDSIGIARLFSEIASRYDFLNHLFSLNIDRLWRKALVRSARLRNGVRILDACTGTADLAIEFGKSCFACEITAVDFSGKMLRLGREKVRKKGLAEKIIFVKADVLNLPLPDCSFDLVCIGFGLRNLMDRQKGCDEMARLLKSGGRLLVLEFSPFQNGYLGVVYRFYLKNLIPTLGGILSGSAGAYNYLASSIAGFLKPEEVVLMMKKAGLTEISLKPLTGGVACLYSGVKNPIDRLL
jgi:demethylmenaquinone methyltransferase/2-methoxy-6-polyprenyl-1,4-benzoquinol methylase